MALTIAELDRFPRPRDGWPPWALTCTFRASAIPGTGRSDQLEYGANCQLCAYAVLALFDRCVAPHRSSELWEDPALSRVALDDAEDLDLALFSATGDAWGAHVAVVLGDRLLHLSAEVGWPALWRWEDFEERPRYRILVGLIRAPATGNYRSE